MALIVQGRRCVSMESAFDSWMEKKVEREDEPILTNNFHVSKG